MKLSVINAKSLKELLSLEVTQETTIGNLKEKIYQIKPKLYPSRQSLRLETRGKSLNDSETLKSVGITEDEAQIYLKDLGPQIGWTTVFLLEYSGQLVLYLLLYTQPYLVYGANASSQPMAKVVHIAAACWALHYGKRLLETLFVHRFSKGTMPLFNLFKNCSYYWGFGVLAGYFVNHPLYTPPMYGDVQIYAGLAGFIFNEYGNFVIHCALRDLRPSDQCKRMMFKKRLTGKALTKFVFKRIQATENFCRALCYMNTDRCLSVNYGDEICELNESDHVIHPENLVTKQGYVYYAAENTCKCSKTELCRYNFASNTFKCLCNANDPAADCKASTNSPQSSVASPSSKSRTRTSKSVKTDTTSSSPNTTRAPPPHKTTSSPSIKSNPTSSTSPPKTTGHGSTSAASPPTSETSFSSKSSPTTTKLTPNTSGGHDPSSTTSTSSTSATSSASVSASPSSTPSATTTTDSSTSTGSTQIKILMTTTSAPETKSSLQTSTTSSLSTPTEASKSLDIEVVSGSSTMPFKVMNTEYERELAGFNFLVLNLNGTPYESGNNPVRGFDTKHDNPSGAVDLLKKYVKNIPIGKIVLMAIQKSDHMPDRSEFLGVLPILPSIGSKVITFAALDGKKGWSLIGYKKAYIQSWPSSPSSPSWVEENISEKDNDLLAKTISPGSP